MNSLHYHHFEAPFGTVHLYACDDYLRAIVFKPWKAVEPESCVEGTNSVLEQAQSQLEEYFSGTRSNFSVPVKAQSTDFQKQVWDYLTNIPYGETQSYGQMAKGLGRPTASRAVGMANGKNPLSIIVPCHRVIGANGSLTGYAGGIDAKRWLLEHEQKHKKQ